MYGQRDLTGPYQPALVRTRVAITMTFYLPLTVKQMVH